MRQLGLLIFTAIFLDGGWRQLSEPEPRAILARQIGLEVPEDLVRASGVAMLLAAVALQVPSLRRTAAGWLALQIPLLTLIGHRFWEHQPPALFWERIQFLKNVSLTGAALYLASERVAHGSPPPRTLNGGAAPGR